MTNINFVTPDIIEEKTIVNGVTDADLFQHHISIAQDRHIQNVLGSRLYVKLQSLIADGTIGDGKNSDYKYLLDEFVVPMTIFYTVVDLSLIHI